MNNPEKPATLCTQDTGRGQAKRKAQHIKTKPMRNTDPTKLLKWTESGGLVSRDDQKMWCGKPTSKIKFHLKAYICRLQSRVVLHIFRVHAHILAVTKLYVLAMDVS